MVERKEEKRYRELEKKQRHREKGGERTRKQAIFQVFLILYFAFS
jgi:hypothetical protein